MARRQNPYYGTLRSFHRANERRLQSMRRQVDAQRGGSPHVGPRLGASLESPRQVWSSREDTVYVVVPQERSGRPWFAFFVVPVIILLAVLILSGGLQP